MPNKSHTQKHTTPPPSPKEQIHLPSSLSSKKMHHSMIFNLQISHGLPLCLSGFTTPHPPLNLSNEIADHDRRREAMKKQKIQEREVGVEDQEMSFEGVYERLVLEITESVKSLMFDGDLDLKCLPCTAKAA